MLKFLRLAACTAIALLSHPPAQGGLVINEIMANNESGVPADGGYPDWVEIYNTGPGSVNLQGHTLTDNLTTPNKFTFTQSHTLAAGQFLVVWCSGNATLGSLHAPFSLSDSGEEVGLFGPGGNRLDSVKFGLQPPNYSISRFPDGTGTWSLSAFTPGASNEVQPLGNPRRVVINEWMASPASGDDWIELYNPEVLPVSISGFYLSDATVSPATNRPLRALSFMAAEGYLQLFASGLAKTDGDHLDFRLNNSGETLSILTDDARTVSHRMTYGRQEANTSQGRLPDGADNIQSFPVGKPTPAASNFVPITDVWINEVLAHTDPPFEDAVELYNPTSLPVNISYWWLSNAKGEPKKYRFPQNSIIQPNSYWVVYQQQFDAGNPRVPFRFNSARGDECYLFSGDSAERLLGGRTLIKVPPTENRVSWGRVTAHESSDFAPMQSTTFGEDRATSVEQFRLGKGLPNSSPKIGPVVISEIMYHPDSGSDTNDNTLDEYIELKNLQSFDARLYHPFTPVNNPSNAWSIGGSVRYTFPTVTTLAAGERVVVTAFDPAQAVQTQMFRSKFGIPDSVRLFGPFRGKLSNSEGSVELYKPDEIQGPLHPDAGLIPMILVEKVSYLDEAPWPTDPDGKGPSLHRVALLSYANSPGNWISATPTPGSSRAPSSPPRIESISRENGAIRFSFTPEAGFKYALEYAEKLPPQTWHATGQSIGATNTQRATLSDTPPAWARFRYYRLSVTADE